MRRILESDTGVYVTAGAFMIVVFVVGLVALTASTPVTLGTRDLFGFVVGFAIFVGIYFFSMAAYGYLSR